MEPPTGLIPWFSKTEGNTYPTLLHHPFLLKGKTNACSRGSRGSRKENVSRLTVFSFSSGAALQELHNSPRAVLEASRLSPHTRTSAVTIPRQRYCGMKRPEPTLHDCVHETGSTNVLLHIGGWQVSVSPTLVESSLTMAGPC